MNSMATKPRWRHTLSRIAFVLTGGSALLLGTFVFGVSAASAAGTSYYVDCSTTGPGSGTSTSPWSTLASVNSKAGGFSPGDQILLRAGTACSGQLAPSGSGTTSSPIIVSSYGTGAPPTINGGGATEAAVYLQNLDYWTVQNLNVTNQAASPAQRSGILVEATDNSVHHGITISNDTVTLVSGISERIDGRYSSAGILVRTPALGSANSGSFDGITIENNTVSNVNCMGIGIVGGSGQDANTRNTNVLISGNLINRPAADGIVVGASTSPLIQYNTSNDAGYAGNGTPFIAAIWGYADSDPTFQFNEAARTQASGDSEAWDCDWGITGTCTYQYNYSHENDGGFFLDCTHCGATSTSPKIVVRYNISQNESRVVSSSSSASDVKMYNNTFYAPGRSFSIPLQSGATLANNIFVGSGFSYNSSTVLESNLYSGFAAPAADATAVASMPLLQSPGLGSAGLASAAAYQLVTSSPGMNAGSVISSNGGRDFFGSSVSSTSSPNIGAYQGSGVAAAPPAPQAVISNPGFESGTAGAWSQYAGASVTTGGRTGTYAVNLPSSGSGSNQTVTGLQPNATYTLSGWTKSNSASDQVAIGAKWYGGLETAAYSSSTSWQQSSVTFTTGASDTSVVIYCYEVSAVTGSQCDDFTLTPLLPNGGFEMGASSWAPIGSTNNDYVVPSPVHSGAFALETPIGGHDGIQQVITGLQPSTTYTLRGWGSVDTAGEELRIGVYNYGGSEQYSSITSGSYVQVAVTFTTSSTSSSATVYCLKQAGNGHGYCDDLTLSQ